MRKIVALLLCLAVVFSAACADTVFLGEYIPESIDPADLAFGTGEHPVGQEAVILTNDLKYGDKGTAVYSLRRKLAQLGYLLDDGSDVYDKNVKEAVAAYETYLNDRGAALVASAEGEAVSEPEHITVDGIADTLLLERLYSSDDLGIIGELKPGDKGSEVRRLQVRLKNLGYLPGSPTGTYDANTRTAVRAFQNALHTIENGFATVETQQFLYSADTRPTPYTACGLGDSGEAVKSVQDTLRRLGFSTATESDSAYGQQTANAVKQLQTYLKQRGVTLGDYEIKESTVSKSVRPADRSMGLPMDDPGIEVAPVTVLETIRVGQGETIYSFSEDPYDINANGVMDTLLRAYLENETTLTEIDTLKMNSSGEDVKRVQRRLVSLEYMFSTPDGIYGDNTVTAITKFQSRNDLPETGVCDTETLKTLFSADAKNGMRTYMLEINVAKQRVYAYTYDENDEYTILVRTMVCSTGTRDNPTPYGTYTNTARGGRWHYFEKWDCWAQYAFYIQGDIMFHSVLYSEQDESTLSRGSLNNLGRRASHGCVRLSVADAKWIWSNCESHTTVVVD